MVDDVNAAKVITPILEVDTTVQGQDLDVEEFDEGFWNLSEVGFLNH